MRHHLTLTVPAPGGAENEDALPADGEVVVVVDGAGLPTELRAGCRHTVAWFAQSVAQTFPALLAARSSSMSRALAETITAVRRSHAPIGDIAGVVACTDGGARAYDLLGTHTLDEFTNLAVRGELRALADSIRAAESDRAEDLRARGMKLHDDITIVTARFDEPNTTSTHEERG